MNGKGNMDLNFCPKIQRPTKLRAHKTNPSSVLHIFTLHPVCLSVLLLLLPHHTEAMRKRVRSPGQGWSSTFWPWTRQVCFSSVTLEISLSENFIFLIYKMGIVDQNVEFLSKPQSLKYYCIYHGPDFPCQGLGTEVTPLFALIVCSPRLTHSGAKVMPSQQFRKPP